ncbi:cytochrome C oxidase subunit IV family protein [Ruegeria arenilitoris]|uniref:cytochrome C oxidase subunit IV family protein n=1 Tax=Ruegeria arenilitoris TaxID=1173585 RepID=UPI0020C42BC1|nr:cytochrome C oxidase subunit IV family protein [Ruegeria arenilitoris]
MGFSSSIPKHSRRRLPSPITCAWLTLLALSVASAMLTMMPIPSKLLGGGILILALAKSRIILAQYLDLATSPPWLRGFTMVLTGFAVVIFCLFLI